MFEQEMRAGPERPSALSPHVVKLLTSASVLNPIGASKVLPSLCDTVCMPRELKTAMSWLKAIGAGRWHACVLQPQTFAASSSDVLLLKGSPTRFAESKLTQKASNIHVHPTFCSGKAINEALEQLVPLKTAGHEDQHREPDYGHAEETLAHNEGKGDEGSTANLICVKIEIDDDKKLYPLFDKRMAQEVPGDTLGDEFKGYVFRIGGGNDKQGFPMKQGVLCNHRVRLLFKKGMTCYRERRKGMRKRKSVRGCIVGQDLAVLHLVMVKKGEQDIPGLTASWHPAAGLQDPQALWFGEEGRSADDFQVDDVRQFVVRREVKDGKKSKATMTAMVYPSHNPVALTRKRMEAGKEMKAQYQKRLSEYHHEQKEKRAADLQKKKARSRAGGRIDR
eukprot:Skav203525  [mRNA]  locus=scaffold687:297247:302390:+ [translate_table: standard]